MQFIDEEIFLLAPADYRVMPWKNGGGATREILVYPSGSDDFDWRLSIADIQQDGPFSQFPGYARSIMLLEGDGMRLQMDNAAEITVRKKFRPLDFDGGSETHCALTGGAIRDFNIISAKDRVTHACTVIEHFPFAAGSKRNTSALVVFALQGETRVRVTRAAAITVPEAHTLLVAAPERLQQLNARSNAKALLISVKYHAQEFPCPAPS